MFNFLKLELLLGSFDPESNLNFSDEERLGVKQRKEVFSGGHYRLWQNLNLRVRKISTGLRNLFQPNVDSLVS